MTQWYDRTGQAITPEQAAQLRANPEYVNVARFDAGAHAVSTIWVGADPHPGEPQIFEVHIVGPSEPRWLKRYATVEAAHAGHEQAVQVLQTVSVVWGVGNGGSIEHAFPAVAAEPDEDLWSLCVFARSLTDPPTERGDLERCPTCQHQYAKRTEGLKQS